MDDAGGQGADRGGFFLVDVFLALDFALALALRELGRRPIQGLGEPADLVAAAGQIAVGQALALDHGRRVHLQGFQVAADRAEKPAAGDADGHQAENTDHQRGDRHAVTVAAEAVHPAVLLRANLVDAASQQRLGVVQLVAQGRYARQGRIDISLVERSLQREQRCLGPGMAHRQALVERAHQGELIAQALPVDIVTVDEDLRAQVLQGAQGGEVGLRYRPLALVDLAQLLDFVDQHRFLIEHEQREAGGVDRQHRECEHPLGLQRQFGNHDNWISAVIERRGISLQG